MLMINACIWFILHIISSEKKRKCVNHLVKQSDVYYDPFIHVARTYLLCIIIMYIIIVQRNMRVRKFFLNDPPSMSVHSYTPYTMGKGRIFSSTPCHRVTYATNPKYIFYSTGCLNCQYLLQGQVKCFNWSNREN